MTARTDIDVSKLIGDLGSPEAIVRRTAIFHLGRVLEPRAVPAIKKVASDDPSTGLRYLAQKLLAVYEDRKAESPAPVRLEVGTEGQIAGTLASDRPCEPLPHRAPIENEAEEISRLESLLTDLDPEVAGMALKDLEVLAGKGVPGAGLAVETAVLLGIGAARREDVQRPGRPEAARRASTAPAPPGDRAPEVAMVEEAADGAVPHLDAVPVPARPVASRTFTCPGCKGPVQPPVLAGATRFPCPACGALLLMMTQFHDQPQLLAPAPAIVSDQPSPAAVVPPDQPPRAEAVQPERCEPSRPRGAPDRDPPARSGWLAFVAMVSVGMVVMAVAYQLAGPDVAETPSTRGPPLEVASPGGVVPGPSSPPPASPESKAPPSSTSAESLVASPLGVEAPNRITLKTTYRSAAGMHGVFVRREWPGPIEGAVNSRLPDSRWSIREVSLEPCRVARRSSVRFYRSERGQIRSAFVEVGARIRATYGAGECGKRSTRGACTACSACRSPASSPSAG